MSISPHDFLHFLGPFEIERHILQLFDKAWRGFFSLDRFFYKVRNILKCIIEVRECTQTATFHYRALYEDRFSCTSFQFLTLQGSDRCTVSWWIIYSARADVVVAKYVIAAEYPKPHSCELGFQVKRILRKSTQENRWQKSPFERIDDAIRNLRWITFFRKMTGNNFIKVGCVGSDVFFDPTFKGRRQWL